MTLDYKISTITVSMKIPDCNLNLVNIGKYMDIEPSGNIKGIKYNFGKDSILKGKYSTSIYNKSKMKNICKINTKLFYNQISIIVEFNNNKNELRTVNVKLFGNGSLHLTGIKHPSECEIIMSIIYERLLSLTDKYMKILLVKDKNNIYTDNDNNIYSDRLKQIIGYKYIDEHDETVYNINDKNYVIDVKSGFFISKKFESKRTKTILNYDGVKVGFSKIELTKNKSKLYKNNININFDYTNGYIYYDGYEKSIIVGNIIYEINEKIPDKIERMDKKIIEYNYNCNPFTNNSIIYKDDYKGDCFRNVDINCINIYFKLEFELNRQRLFNELINMDFICEYKPEKYSGVKLRYKISTINVDQNGICKCSNKCTCNTITFLIFQSGNVIVIGFKSLDEIQPIVDEFEIIINNIRQNIRKKMLMSLKNVNSIYL